MFRLPTFQSDPSPQLSTAVRSWFRGLAVAGLLTLAVQPSALAAEVDSDSQQIRGTEQTSDNASQYFENKVRPLLANRCFSCHGEKKQESDLRLDARAAILQGGASGDAAVEIGNPDASVMIQYIRREVEGMEMPPDKPLNPQEVAILEQWVRDGLFWPRNDAVKVETMDDRFSQHRDSHWAFQPVAAVLPDDSSWDESMQRWPQSQLDYFVAANLHEHQMTPAHEADRTTLLRRLKFDLIGLPPTIEETTQFKNDPRPDAYEQLVDRYLASPGYGERWGRHWLDVARYADTRGYTFGGADRNYAWSYTYRDYVIRAFNDDLPYDDFIVQQLAADRLELGEDNRALAGLGFLTVGRKFNNQHDDLDDLIDAVTRGFLGLTVACARCHDHKYDAIPTEDYYSLYGVFNSSHESAKPLIGDAKTLEAAHKFEQKFNQVNDKLRTFDDQLFNRIVDEARTHLKEYLSAAVSETLDEELRPYLVRQWKSLLRKKAKPDSPTLMPWSRLMDIDDADFEATAKQLAMEIGGETGDFLNPYVRDSFVAKPPMSKAELTDWFGEVLLEAFAKWKAAGANDAARRKQTAEVRQLLWYFFDPNSPAKIDRGKLDRYANSEEKQQRESKKTAVAKVQRTQPVAYHRAMVVTDKSKPMNAKVFIRGNAARRGEKVPRRGPKLLAKPQRPYTNGSGRLELAHEITNPNNPLTARVFVNRVWMHHFGRPLVATPSDFGIRCDEPLQQNLLDHLAGVLVHSNWSVKALHRELLLSATYRQASDDRPQCYAVDPENNLLWRMNRRRLEFEILRDALLFTGGNLEHRMGGKPVRQFRKTTSGQGEGARRSVYGYIDRQDLPNLLRVFDFAGPDASAEKRSATTVPQQALFMLNSPFVIQQAKAITRTLEQSLSSLDNRDRANPDSDATAFVDAVYRRVLARTPSDRERRVAVTFLQTTSNQSTPTVSSSADSRFSKRGELSLREQLAQLLLLTNEFSYVD